MSSCATLFAFTSFSNPVWCAILFAAATVGHCALMVASHNWWYGQPFPRKAGDVIHFLHLLLVCLGPVLFWLWAGWDLTALFVWNSDTPWWQFALAAYVALCWLTAFVLFPANTLARLLRPRPRALA